MQLIDTYVGTATDGMITVEFKGDGGELISVKMAASDRLQDGAAITRAKAMMVQLTTFAEDRDTSKDAWNDSKDASAESDDRVSERAEDKSELSVVSASGEAPSSAP